MTTRRISRWAAGFAACVSILLVAAPNRAADPKPEEKWPTQRTSQPEDIEDLKALELRVKSVVEKCTPSTVAVLIGFGAGSGVIVNEDGLVLTAAHVIAGDPTHGKGKSKGYEAGTECTIVLQDGKKVKGKTLGVNEKADSGMVQITDKGPNNGKWPFTPMAASKDLKTGQWVVSLGHPNGPKTGRAPVARLGQMEPAEKHPLHKGFIVSNCTLVGGDSGGPLFDLDGKVIGIHSRIGFTLSTNVHVPTEKFKAEWDDLVAGKAVGQEPPVNKGNGATIGIVFPEDENDDAWVSALTDDGPAAKAGLAVGDTITKFNGQAIKSVKRLRELLLERKPGEVVKLSVRRGAEVLTPSVTLGKKAG